MGVEGEKEEGERLGVRDKGLRCGIEEIDVVE